MKEIKDVEKFKKNYKLYNLYSTLITVVSALCIFMVAFIIVQIIKGVNEVFSLTNILIIIGEIIALFGCNIMRCYYENTMDKMIAEAEEVTHGEEEV